MRSPDLDVVALMAGVGFVGLGLVSLLGQSAGATVRWAVPLLLILAGVIGLVASRRGSGGEARPTP